MNSVHGKLKNESTLALGFKERVGFCWTKVDERKVLDAHA